MLFCVFCEVWTEVWYGIQMDVVLHVKYVYLSVSTWQRRRHWRQPTLSSQKTHQGDYDCNVWSWAPREVRHENWLLVGRETCSWWALNPSTTQTRRLTSVKLTADNDVITTYRLDVGYTVISCFFRPLILYNCSVTWRKYDFWCYCELKDGRPPSFEYWL